MSGAPPKPPIQPIPKAPILKAPNLNAPILKAPILKAPNLKAPMAMALDLAREAASLGEVPVGAVVVCDGVVIAGAGNRTILDRDPTAHAEMLAIRAACAARGSERLVGCDLYVTLEPCAMCAAAISFARIRRLYFGCDDPKGGGVENGPRFFSQPTCHHAPDEVLGGMSESEARELLKEFFSARR